jgi:CRISPR-associated protein Csx17
LKALGILRLISEDNKHGDPKATGCWNRDRFELHSSLDRNELIEFFLYNYQPTPIVVPWSGSDFFGVNWEIKAEEFQSTFDKRPTSSKIIEAFLALKCPRLKRYPEVLRLVQKTLNAGCVHIKKDIEGNGRNQRANKARLLQALRNFLPDDLLAWLDSATVIETDELAFNNVLGSGGGSDGNSHFSDNFMQALWMVLPDFDAQRKKPVQAAAGVPFDSKAALRESLFGSAEQATSIAEFSPVLFNSSRVGGPNSTSGFDAGAASNPWDFILMLEGAFLFAGAVSKKLDSNQTGLARFPFLVEATPVGLASVGDRDDRNEGREVWLPLWERPVTYSELTYIFAEARLEKFGHSATTGFDAFVALAQHGVDRGIRIFRRIGLVRGRVGGDNYFTSIDQGVFRVRQDKAVDLLDELEKWHSELRKFARDHSCPISIVRALRQYETSIVEMSQRGSRDAVTMVIIALGQLEKTLGKSFRQVKREGISPVPCLTLDWLRQANCDSQEFRLAAALASTHGFYKREALPLRSQLEPVEQRGSNNHCWFEWADNKSNDVQWSEAPLPLVLNAIFARRLLRAEQAGIGNLPDTSRCYAKLRDITAFIEGETDNDLLAGLLWGLDLLDWSKGKESVLTVGTDDNVGTPPSLYALLKLCFLPKCRHDDDSIPLVPAIHRRATVDDGTAASELAIRRLRSFGLHPAVDIISLRGEIVQRTAAALLFPIHSQTINQLRETVLRRFAST